ncbi:hypothetical protein [Kitasatospora sp. NPDC087315]|uniref:hypothetical protein n=1 Tax=Kitasatospora sp. NPDC087315 TaxID=3364069 RepID=UPI0038181E1D
MTTTVPSPAAALTEIARLTDELRSLYRLPARTDEDDQRITDTKLRLRTLAAVPPTGHTLPKPAADLIAHAHTHGWEAYPYWTHGPGIENPFVLVHLAYLLTPAESANYRSDRWTFQYTWHSRGCAPGRMRRFGAGTVCSPGGLHNAPAPSLRTAIAVIANPVRP